MIILSDTAPVTLRKYLRKQKDNETRNPHKYKNEQNLMDIEYTWIS